MSSCFFFLILKKSLTSRYDAGKKKKKVAQSSAAVKSKKYDLLRKVEWRSKRSVWLEISSPPLKRDTWSIAGWFDLARDKTESDSKITKQLQAWLCWWSGRFFLEFTDSWRICFFINECLQWAEAALPHHILFIHKLHIGYQLPD